MTRLLQPDSRAVIRSYTGITCSVVTCVQVHLKKSEATDWLACGLSQSAGQWLYYWTVAWNVIDVTFFGAATGLVAAAVSVPSALMVKRYSALVDPLLTATYKY